MNETLENVFVGICFVVLIALGIFTIVMLAGAISDGLTLPNHEAECLDRGYTGYQVFREDGEIKMYCTRLRNGTEEVYRLILEEQ